MTWWDQASIKSACSINKQACVYFPASDIDIGDLVAIEKAQNTLGKKLTNMAINSLFRLLHQFIWYM